MPRRDNRRPGKPAVDRDHASSRPQSALDSAAPCSLRQQLPLAHSDLADIGEPAPSGSRSFERPVTPRRPC